MNIKPSIEKVHELSSEYMTVPVSTELSFDYSPDDVVKKLKNISSHVFMLESCEDSQTWGRYTFLGFDPKVEITCKDYEVTVTDEYGVMKYTGNPKEYIQKILDEHKSPKFDYLPTFVGGLVGYFSYDYIKYSEKGIQINALDDGNFKDVDLMLFDKVIAFDNRDKKIIIICNIQTDNIDDNYKSAILELKIMQEVIENGETVIPEPVQLKTDFIELFNEKQYSDMVNKAKYYIHEGDIFQVVLSNRLEAEMTGSLLNTYENLKEINPSPYMFYFSSNDIEIAGASPETLVKLDGETLYTYPLAGTRPRGKTKEDDDEVQKSLLSDEKELAEHNMLVDLGRNDLGKISEFGTVRVEQYHNILRFSHVMHIGSTVSGKIREGFGALDAIDAVLPAGTLTGAPKNRAMQIIDEHENNRRGIYGGAIGYIDFTGNLDTCISIRLAYKKNNKVYVRSGAGIVADSIPEKEHMECINKARAVVNALEGRMK